MEKEQSNVGLSSEDEEVLNQKLPSQAAASVAQDLTETEATDTVKVCFLWQWWIYYKL